MKLTPVKTGITEENLSKDNTLIEKNIDININDIATIILKSSKKTKNSPIVEIASEFNLFLIIDAPATLNMAYKNENSKIL